MNNENNIEKIIELLIPGRYICVRCGAHGQAVEQPDSSLNTIDEFDFETLELTPYERRLCATCWKAAPEAEKNEIKGLVSRATREKYK